MIDRWVMLKWHNKGTINTRRPFLKRMLFLRRHKENPKNRCVPWLARIANSTPAFNLLNLKRLGGGHSRIRTYDFHRVNFVSSFNSEACTDQEGTRGCIGSTFPYNCALVVPSRVPPPTLSQVGFTELVADKGEDTPLDGGDSSTEKINVRAFLKTDRLPVARNSRSNASLAHEGKISIDTYQERM